MFHFSIRFELSVRVELYLRQRKANLFSINDTIWVSGDDLVGETVYVFNMLGWVMC